MQQKQDWIASIETNRICESDTALAIAGKSYRQAVNYTITGNIDSAFIFLNIFLDNSIADYMVIVDPYLNLLRHDTTPSLNSLTLIPRSNIR